MTDILIAAFGVSTPIVIFLMVFFLLMLLVSDVKSKSVCDELVLSGNCTCDDLPGPVASVKCPVEVFEQTVYVGMDVEPCRKPARIDMTVSWESGQYSFTVLSTDDVEEIPIPGLSLYIPGVGDVGMDVAVGFSGNVDELTVKVGLDACVAVLGQRLCGNSLTHTLPIWIAQGTVSLGDMCDSPSSFAAGSLVLLGIILISFAGCIEFRRRSSRTVLLKPCLHEEFNGMSLQAQKCEDVNDQCAEESACGLGS